MKPWNLSMGRDLVHESYEGLVDWRIGPWEKIKVWK